MASYIPYTLPTRNVHPRLRVNPSTLATYQARIAGSHSGYWSSLLSFCSSKVGSVNSYWEGKSAEYLAVFAFAYLLDNANLSYGQKARDVALYIANLAMPSGFDRRQYCTMMALTYTWCFGLLTDTQRQTLRNRVAEYVNAMRGVNPAEYLWGHSHGYAAYALANLPAILEDGSSAENTTWRGWMDSLLDSFDNGGNNCFLAGFRYFGQGDGGSHKGIGCPGYYERSEEFYTHLIPSLKTSVGVDLFSTEDWYRLGIHYVLWHLRGDRTVFRHGEGSGQSHYSLYTQVHAWQVADLENNDYGKAAQWLASEIESLGDFKVWGPYLIYSILHHNTGRISQKPTIANQGGNQMRVFEDMALAAFRPGWEDGDAALIFLMPKAFTGGHSHRDAGSIQLARRKPFLVDHGHYDAADIWTYKVPGDSLHTGHRYTYYAQGLAHSGIMVYDSDEPSENEINSHRRLIGSSSRFGVWNGSSVDISNQGGLLWPKDAADAQYQPYHIGDVIAQAKWTMPAYRHGSQGAKYAYAVADLAEWYYASKITKVRRHVLWVKRGQIPGWPYEVALVFDDLVTHVDAHPTHGGKKTQRLFWQTQVAPTGTAASWQVDRAPDRLFVRVLAPSVEWATVQGFKDLDGVEYPHISSDPQDDSLVGVYRTELWPASSGGTQQFLTVLFPCPDTESAPTSLTLINDGSYIGATIGGVDCKIAKGDVHSASVGDSPDTTPPAVPTNLSGTPKNQAAELDWDDNVESDFDHYELWRRHAI